uniref:chemokine (C-C motif) ligand 39, duplicate 3 precursor n=1 Tax=Danio rerio TaxID=7955 RepID=UPI0001630D6D|nr:chemokine CCL-C25o [Danio rerio]
MRSLMFLLVLVLFCSLQDTSSAMDAIISANSVCCEGITHKKITLKQIVSYHWTTSSCAKKAIVFTTKAGKKICVDPENTFVKRQVVILDSRAKV